MKTFKSIALCVVVVLFFSLPAFAANFPAQQDIPLDKEWRITFSRPVDASTLQGNIVINRTDIEESFPVAPTLDPTDSKVVTVKHSTPFAAGASYKLSVNIGVKDVSGKSLSRAESLSFTTEQPSYSYSNPAPLNTIQTIHVQDYSDDYAAEIVIKEIIRGSQAQAMLPYNDKQKDGYECLLAKIDFNLIDIVDGKNFWIYSSKLKMVSDKNVMYDSYVVAEPDPKFNGTLYKGGSIEGWAAYSVKEDDLRPKLSFGTKYDGTGGIWFKAYAE